jgi:CDP-glucose 4,6-dehydratase
MGTVNILEAIRNTDCVRSFVNVTTDKVYENKDESEHPFKEEENLDGFDPYSNSKSCSELVTRCYKRSFFQKSKVCISTARAGNVIGGGDFSPNRIIPDCVRAIESKKPIEIRNPYSTRPYQFVLEPLFAYLLIAEKQLSGKSGSFNIGPDSADFVSTGSLVSLFCKKWGPSANYVDKSVIGAPHEASFLSLDNSLFKQTFSWSPVYHIDKAIDEIVEWTKTYFAGGDIAAVVDKQIFEFSKRFLQ